MFRFLHSIIVLIILFSGCRNHQPTEYIINEKELVPEGIAYSSKNNTFYLSGIGKPKIIMLDKKTGKQQDFISEREYGYMPGVGIYVDDNRNRLHALGGYYKLNDSVSSLYTFDLNTRELIKRYNLSKSQDHFLNDLVLDSKGTIYLTDTKAASIYYITPQNDSLQLFYQSEEIMHPNGIAISDDNSKLYIASYRKGVRIMDIETKQLLNRADTTNATCGIDGLEFYQGNLYAIQNGVKKNSFNFRKLNLNSALDTILNVEVIDSHTKKLNVPLTFCIAEGKAVVIGNSNLRNFDQINLKFYQPDSVKKTKLLVYKLD